MEPSVKRKEILKLKLQFEELQERKTLLIKKQEYEAVSNIKVEQDLIISQLDHFKIILETQLNSLERTVLNYPLIQKIHNILLEFNEKDLEFRTEFFGEMNQHYDKLGIKWKELQQSGDFTNAKEVNIQRVEIGNFIGKIPN